MHPCPPEASAPQPGMAPATGRGDRGARGAWGAGADRRGLPAVRASTGRCTGGGRWEPPPTPGCVVRPRGWDGTATVGARAGPAPKSLGVGCRERRAQSACSDLGAGCRERRARSACSDLGAGCRERRAQSACSDLGAGCRERRAQSACSDLGAGCRERRAQSACSDLGPEAPGWTKPKA